MNTPSDGSSGSITFTISTAFNSTDAEERQSDLIIVSSDSVLFYVHSGRLVEASSNGFNGHFPHTPRASTSGNDLVIAVPERSTVINLLLLAVYRMSCTQYMPSFEDLSETVGTLNIYGLQAEPYISPGSPLFDALLTHAPTQPLDLYAFAASRSFHELAVATSPHLLSFPLSSLSDEMAERIGPVYLKKLFFLHLGRTDALKQLLQAPPRLHVPTPSCGFEAQRELTRAWALASAYLTWDARPHIGASTIEAELRNLADHLSCELCKQSLRDRVHDLVEQWSAVRVSQAFSLLTITLRDIMC